LPVESVDVQERAILHTAEPVGSYGVLQVGGKPAARLYKTSYPANDPSEDRSTVVVGDNFVFTGVWDGHGGTKCAEYCETAIWPAFQSAVRDRAGGVSTIADAFKHSYTKTDKDYLALGLKKADPKILFAGSCAVACYIDLVKKVVGCGNIGDSRAVAGVYEGSPAALKLTCVNLSKDQSAEDEEEAQRVKDLHPGDAECVVDMDDPKYGGYGDDPDLRVKKIGARPWGPKPRRIIIEEKPQAGAIG
jgi:hypothetical protein